jgi:hypothetical protein
MAERSYTLTVDMVLKRSDGQFPWSYLMEPVWWVLA